jgi:hypothetical protein
VERGTRKMQLCENTVESNHTNREGSAAYIDIWDDPVTRLLLECRRNVRPFSCGCIRHLTGCSKCESAENGTIEISLTGQRLHME